MSEKTKKAVKAIVIVLVFVLCMALIVIGQRNIGPAGLGMMFVGLAGLIFLLWLYNRQYK